MLFSNGMVWTSMKSMCGDNADIACFQPARSISASSPGQADVTPSACVWHDVGLPWAGISRAVGLNGLEASLRACGLIPARILLYPLAGLAPARLHLWNVEHAVALLADELAAVPLQKIV